MKRYLRRHDLAERYRCTDRNIDLMVRDGRLPQRTLQRGRFPLWDEAIIDEHDHAAARAFKMKAVTADAALDDRTTHPTTT
jgi:hypothetical protein